MPIPAKHHKGTVAIIGAGPSGLVAAKECLEAGLQPTLFESTSDLGGVWHPQTGKTWHGMRTNLSRFHMGFSDMPFNSAHDFPLNTEVYDYLHDYAAAFQIAPHIAYNQRVTHFGYDRAHKGWKLETDTGHKALYDGVMMAGGYFNAPHIPTLKGRDQFQGTLHHAADYKNADSLKKGKTLVVGGSFSAHEIAAHIADHGHDVTHLFRRAAWVITRYTKDIYGRLIPSDILNYYYKNTRDEPAIAPEYKKYMRAAHLEECFGNSGKAHPAMQVDIEQPYNILYLTIMSTWSRIRK